MIHVASGGLLDRRSFLHHGLAFSSVISTGSVMAGTPANASNTPEQIAPWMRQAGTTDVPYGTPGAAEQHVVKTATVRAPQEAIFNMWHTPLQHLRGTITPNGLHFGVHHNGIPAIDPAQHRLMIHGLVNKPVQFDLEQLMRFPMESRITFLECSGNTAPNALSPFARDESCQDLFGQASCTEWTGIPMRLILQQAGVKAKATWCVAEGADGGSHTRSIPMNRIMDDAMLALFQNGERIRPAQGYPMRLLVPGCEGNMNVKWLHRLELTDQPAYSKDESGLYSEVLANGQIERFTFVMGVKSVITHPSGQQQLSTPNGYYEVSGLAWSGSGKVRQVEVSADGGKTWALAKLHGPVLDKSFTRFSIPWHWSGRPATLMSRATDDRGHVQPTREVWKKRYAAHSFNHYNAIQCWHINRHGRVENVYA